MLFLKSKMKHSSYGKMLPHLIIQFLLLNINICLYVAFLRKEGMVEYFLHENYIIGF